MKISSQRDKRNYIIIALCLIVVIMGVGYAAFSSLLTINGTANISNSWCVGFDNTKTSDLQITKGLSTGTTPTGSMSYSGTACGTNLVPTSSLVAHFYQPGDQIEYTLTITNKSTVTAAIKSILVDNESVTSNTTKNKDNITYIIEMPESTTLAPNASTTMKVTAKFQNETDVTGPYSGETKTIEVKINAEQDDGNGGMDITPATFTGSIYRLSKTEVQDGNYIVAGSRTKWCQVIQQSGFSSCDYGIGGVNTESECNSGIQNAISQGYIQEGEYTCQQRTITSEGIGGYTTDASTLNNNYYLKHDVVDDMIMASYVCFVYNNQEYCMKGGDNGASFASNTQIIEDAQTFSNEQSPCTFTSDSSYCHLLYNNLQVRASSGGNVSITGVDSEACSVTSYGWSNCVGGW